jgi:uncharacterized integral membrane protein
MGVIADILRTVFIVLVACAVTLFVVQNLAPMEINFLTWSLQAPRFIGVLVSLLLGVAVGMSLRAFRRRTPKA